MPTALNLFVLWAVLCVAAGWTLSAIRELNLLGYIGFFAATGAICYLLWRQYRLPPERPHRPWAMSRWRRRFHRPLPLVYLVVAALCGLGGIIHAPSNYDALTYRIPRMLRWCAENGWIWIDTANPRQNIFFPNFEWLTTPLYLLTHSDRLFFLTEFAAYLLLPGLIFSVFRAAGVRGRVAWSWMWALPMGYCYVIEAASVGNDAIAVVFALASVRYALEAGRTKRARYVAFALISGAVATGVKATNLPLMLPLAGGVLWGLRHCRISWPWAAAATALAALVSFVPLAILNQIHCGDWLGRAIFVVFQKQLHHTVAMALIGNGIHMAVQMLLPPILPGGRILQNWLWTHMPPAMAAGFRTGMPTFEFYLTELPQEERSGVGLGITILLAASLAFIWRRRRSGATPFWGKAGLAMFFGALGWGSFAYMMTQMGGDVDARVLSPYYPFLLLPIAAHFSQAAAVRRPWWRALALTAGGFAVISVVLTPSRPLWPAGAILSPLAAAHPDNEEILTAQNVFKTYRNRNDLLGPLRRLLPASADVVGVVDSTDDTEFALWRPLGQRRVVRVPIVDKAWPAGVHWVAIKRWALEMNYPAGLEDWVRQHGGSIVATLPIVSKVGSGPEEWVLACFPQSEPAIGSGPEGLPGVRPKLADQERAMGPDAVAQGRQ